MEAAIRGALDQFFIHGARQILININLAGLELVIEGRVFFIDYLVRGEMFAAHRGRLGEGLAPGCEGLAGDGEHQVEVHIIEARLPQDVE